jgi:hypothetical protein
MNLMWINDGNCALPSFKILHHLDKTPIPTGKMNILNDETLSKISPTSEICQFFSYLMIVKEMVFFKPWCNCPSVRTIEKSAACFCLKCVR